MFYSSYSNSGTLPDPEYMRHDDPLVADAGPGGGKPCVEAQMQPPSKAPKAAAWSPTCPSYTEGPPQRGSGDFRQYGFGLGLIFDCYRGSPAVLFRLANNARSMTRTNPTNIGGQHSCELSPPSKDRPCLIRRQHLRCCCPPPLQVNSRQGSQPLLRRRHWPLLELRGLVKRVREWFCIKARLQHPRAWLPQDAGSI
ncbi:hypothetical protein LZ32DRAFT_311466 [Colletotrichum eremochloae]|nr:hypothetical protein LZ32DRAFT_311466 [Colletotrichum eremochloae]